VSDTLSSDALAPFLATTLFRRVQCFESVPSTNSLALDAAERGEPEGTVFLADEQTAGRGRGGHTWHSQRGDGIYCSVILRPRLAPADALFISLAAGLAVVAAVEEACGIRADLRWPNDVLFGDKKFCGILAESAAEGDRLRHVIVGIGINVNQASFPSELNELATSLRIVTGRICTRLQLVAALLQSLDREYRALSSAHAKSDVIARFEAASSYARGKRVRVEDSGTPAYDGVTEGLDPRGFLRVRTSSGELRTVLSGGVRPI
jgi:BirA family transcriptional regulator, biotin operon repressor / biotin---[acetyl-CoA-carboxylase] ligase